MLPGEPLRLLGCILCVLLSKFCFVEILLRGNSGNTAASSVVIPRSCSGCKWYGTRDSCREKSVCVLNRWGTGCDGSLCRIGRGLRLYALIFSLFPFYFCSVPVSPSIHLSCTFLLALIQTEVESELNLS